MLPRILFARTVLIGMVFIVTSMVSAAHAQPRIKDIVEIEGVRDNALVGYGLVVGLNGTGDGINNSPFTRKSLIGMLERLGINITGDNLNATNIAAVVVTADLPAFSRQGRKIDVNISTMGTASSLLGGTLLVTPLLAADGEVYAVAQGNISVGGYTALGEGVGLTKGVVTSGRIANGATVEREINFSFNELEVFDLALRNPDFTTARRVEDVINSYLGVDIARTLDPATVQISVPPYRRGDVVGLMSDIEALRVVPDNPARVVIDDQNGVIVMGENVRISQVAIAHGSLTISIVERPVVSQPNPFSDVGDTVIVPRTEVNVDEGGQSKLTVLQNSVTLAELVEGLNALGVVPRDMITILQAIKVAGALQADIETM